MLRSALRQAIVTLMLTTPALAASPASSAARPYALTIARGVTPSIE